MDEAGTDVTITTVKYDLNLLRKLTFSLHYRQLGLELVLCSVWVFYKKN